MGAEGAKERRETVRHMSADFHILNYSCSFIGRKEGGVNSNSAYYVLTHCQDGTFEALPINGWYDFIPTIKYNYLDADEAEKR